MKVSEKDWKLELEATATGSGTETPVAPTQ